ncbi:hypothetical protein [Dinghuibacter silviterrae]|nr:hypothetical protein [Dinghuibacter silviterrae]
MYVFILAIYWALSCLNHNPRHNAGGQITVLDDSGGGGTGGETGHIPPNP